MDEETKDNFWNFVFSVLFLLVFILSFIILEDRYINISQIDFYELILLSLAVFRLTRLIVYDHAMLFLRRYFIYEKKAGFKKTIGDLLKCPWCTSVWITLLLVYSYFLFPKVTYYFIIIMAISALATFFQITANLIGHKAEISKKESNK